MCSNHEQNKGSNGKNRRNNEDGVGGLPYQLLDLFREFLVPPAGIEPATFGLQNRCSTS
jgi:hypothetical protein